MMQIETRCVWSRCMRPADYLAYATYGAGHAHACEAHAPAWLRAGDYAGKPGRPAAYRPTLPTPQEDAAARLAWGPALSSLGEQARRYLAAAHSAADKREREARS